MSYFTISPGKACQLGAHISAAGTNFCIYSRHASKVMLHLFNKPEDTQASQNIELLRTGDRWHIHLGGCSKGQLYLYTADGPYQIESGLRFNRHKFLQDPYAKALCNTPNILHNDAAYFSAFGFVFGHPEADRSFSDQSNIKVQAKCIVVDDYFDWQGDHPLNYPLADCVIYEAHLKGMTQNCSYQNPGTYLGVIEHIPDLQELGITSIEFLPLMNFSPYDYSERRNCETGAALPLRNYWGYNTRNFFAPATHYAASQEPSAAVAEFKTMLRSLHQAGIEVILDVVFNHSAEAHELGPNLSLRGLDNPSYYILQDQKRYYANYSGCGNTLNCNHPVVRELIIDCLRYWVLEMHVDGFRFDLASSLRRDSASGQEIIASTHSLVEALSQDSILAQTKLIAEPWDATGGAYLLGDFGQSDCGQEHWAEWNDQFRDDVRQFWGGMLPSHKLATRLAGSSDIFDRSQQRPYHSLNFLSCHDGYTLRDLFSYNAKHNLANGEQNRDGHNQNFNRNYGCEGPSTDVDIASLRCRMVKNHLCSLLLSAGTPMLQAGDELGKSQLGNNNAYCQDNQLSWLQYDQSHLEDCEYPFYQSLRRFTAQLISLRRQFTILHRSEFFHSAEARWYGMQNEKLCELQNSEQWFAQDQSLGLLLDSTAGSCTKPEPSFFCIFNAKAQLFDFTLPAKPNSKGPHAYPHWCRIVDTHLAEPNDICVVAEARPPQVLQDHSYPVSAQSVVVLMG